MEYIQPKSEVFNRDCLEMMRGMADKAFDLAIIDPPYGSGDVALFTPRKHLTNLNGTKSIVHKSTEWNIKPTRIYFKELFRVSKNQIIWGGNYFTRFLPESRGWIFWDKKYGNTNNFSAGELAWTSFDKILKMFIYAQRSMPNKPKFLHPTQKPVALYKWLLTNYAKQGDTILDSHMGSGSSRIAAYDLGFDFVGMELDKDYYEAQERRFANHIAQPNLFTTQKQVVESRMFEGF